MALKEWPLVFNLAAPGADTPILGADFVPDKTVSRLEVTVAVATSSVLNLTYTDGSTLLKSSLNGGTALVANSVYTFPIGVRSELAYNFEVETDGIIKLLQADEAVQK